VLDTSITDGTGYKAAARDFWDGVVVP